MLKEKFEYNRARHSKDLSKQHYYLEAKLTAAEALLADIEDVNRIQREKGLPLVNGDVS